MFYIKAFEPAFWAREFNHQLTKVLVLERTINNDVGQTLVYLGEWQVPVYTGIIAVCGGPAHQMRSCEGAFYNRLQLHANRYVFEVLLVTARMH